MNSEDAALRFRAKSGTKPSEVHVCWIRLESFGESLQCWQDRLTADEWARSLRFRVEIDRRRFVLCRSALRTLLGQRLGIAPKGVELIEGRYGKPMLSGKHQQQDWQFNVAHSGQLGCIGMTRNCAIGIDVETIRQPHNLGLMINKVLSPSEVKFYETTPPESRLDVFLRYWTRKEAVAKSTGMGLSLPLDEIEIDLQRDEQLVQLPNRPEFGSGIYTRDLDPNQIDYRSALAVVSNMPPKLTCSEWCESE